MKRRLLAVITVSLCLLCGCGAQVVETPTTLPYEPVTEEISSSPAYAYDRSQVLEIDASWQDSYALSYSFFSSDTSESIIIEAKSDDCYQAMDQTTGIITYLANEDGYLFEYMLNSASRTGTKTLVTDGSVSTANSGFVQLSACDPYFPVYQNVTRVGEDYVAKRSATRYRQTQLDESGRESRIAYVWIDDEYSFASKCELYSASGELLLRWELKSFSVNVDPAGVRLDLSKYRISAE